VVLLPAPLPPSNAVIPPFLTFKLTPFKTKITWLYTTSILLTIKISSDLLGDLVFFCYFNVIHTIFPVDKREPKKIRLSDF
jgi:hypothetical protein